MNSDHLDILLCCSLRYAYGHSSYLTGMVAELIKEYKGELNIVQLDQLTSELRTLLLTQDPGMDIDRHIWEDLLYHLESILKD